MSGSLPPMAGIDDGVRRSREIRPSARSSRLFARRARVRPRPQIGVGTATSRRPRDVAVATLSLLSTGAFFAREASTAIASRAPLVLPADAPASPRAVVVARSPDSSPRSRRRGRWPNPRRASAAAPPALPARGTSRETTRS
eukprot:29903-Pelagococcus_subviridis.AAC.6